MDKTSLGDRMKGKDFYVYIYLNQLIDGEWSYKNHDKNG